MPPRPGTPDPPGGQRSRSQRDIEETTIAEETAVAEAMIDREEVEYDLQSFATCSEAGSGCEPGDQETTGPRGDDESPTADAGQVDCEMADVDSATSGASPTRSGAHAAARAPATVWSLRNAGLGLHCFGGGFVRAVNFGLLYGQLLGVMGMQGHVYVTVQTMLAVPWAMKIVFGMMSDAWPLLGFRRRYYAVGGWALVALSHAYFATIYDEPAPFYCATDAGARGAVCNPETRDTVYLVVGPLFMANLGLALSESAGDGLLLECVSASRTFERKTRIQMEALAIRMIGTGGGGVFLGTCFNSARHLGFYSHDAGMAGVGAACFTVAVLVIVGWTTACQAEVPVRPLDVPVSARPAGACARGCGVAAFLQRRSCTPGFVAFFMYQLLAPAMLSFTSPSVELMRKYWAHVQQMQQQLSHLCTMIVYVLGLWCVDLAISRVSWHSITRASVAAQVLVQTTVHWCTAAARLRDQYFFLFGDLFQSLGVATCFVLALVAAVEMVPSGYEATTYGVLSALYALAPALGRGCANLWYGTFGVVLGVSDMLPSLVDDQQYVLDSRLFRALVVHSVVTTSVVALLSLVLLPMVPRDLTAARRLMVVPRRARVHPGRRAVACGLAVSAALAVVLGTLALNFMAIDPRTSCHVAVGGGGC